MGMKKTGKGKDSDSRIIADPLHSLIFRLAIV
jgi:hypothetical protein